MLNGFGDVDGALAQVRQRRYAYRKGVNQVALLLSLMAMAFGLFWLFWILFETIRLGMDGLTLATLTEMTPPPNDEGAWPMPFMVRC